MPSSQGEFTVQLETRTFLQPSMSMPSRLVSIFRLSIVKLSTPVARMAKWPPAKIVKSRITTFRQSLSAMALLAIPVRTVSLALGKNSGAGLDVGMDAGNVVGAGGVGG